MRDDPTGSVSLTSQGLGHIGPRIGRLGLPTHFVQEGGCTIGKPRAGAHFFFVGLDSAWHD